MTTRWPPSGWTLPAPWTPALAAWCLLVALATGAFWPGLGIMVQTWIDVEEYSHGFFIAPIVAFLVWQRLPALQAAAGRGSWWGVPVLAVAAGLALVGELSAVRLLIQLGFVLALFGLALCCFGLAGMRTIALPLALAALMVPLPQFLLREMSQQLQLLSSQLGVAFIRLAGVPVFLEGNVIDLGHYKLQVVDACSGLRYLFPLTTLGILAAYLYRDAWWKKLLIVAATVPLTIVVNSLRIGVIGWSVDRWGTAMAQGLLHDFEGWFMFLICLGLLMALMAGLARLGPRPRRLIDVFSIDAPEEAMAAARPAAGPGWPAWAGGTVVVALLASSPWLEALAKPPPTLWREPLIGFPLQLDGGWRGRLDSLDPEVLAALALDDHLLANFSRPGGPWVNLYVAYHATQSGGQSSHSPRTCLPGGGWKILEFTTRPLAVAASTGGGPLRVNRSLIQRDAQRQLVYYWFVQGGQVMTDELGVKGAILRDALTRGRSDGALVRVVTPILAAESVDQAEARLLDFLRVGEPRLAVHVAPVERALARRD